MKNLQEFKILVVEMFGEKIELKTPLVIRRGERLFIDDDGEGLIILRVDFSALNSSHKEG